MLEDSFQQLILKFRHTSINQEGMSQVYIPDAMPLIDWKYLDQIALNKVPTSCTLTKLLFIGSISHGGIEKKRNVFSKV